MERSSIHQLNFYKLLFLLYVGPLSYWFFVTVPIDLVISTRINELTALELLFIPIFISALIFFKKISFFSIRLEKLMFIGMILNAVMLFSLFLFYKSIIIVLLCLIVILIVNAINSPYMFSKIFNLVTNKTRIRSICELYLVWFGAGVFYLIFFIFEGPGFTFLISAISVSIGVVIQFFYQIRPKNYTQVQLLPFEYKSIVNGNILAIFFVLILFWSVAIILIKELRVSLFISRTDIVFNRFEIFWVFLLINVIFGLIFYVFNKRLNLQVLYYVDYLIISLSVILVLFWKPLVPLAFFLVSSFGIVTFAFSMPDLMDVNRGIIGPSFIAFFQALLLTFPAIHIILYLINTNLSDTIVSFLLITIIITMALISGIKFLPVPVNIEYLIISHKDGIPIYSAGNASKDEKIISGLLTGILTILNTSSSDKIKTIDHGDKKIMVSLSNRIFGVIVCDRYSKRTGLKLQEIVDLFEAGFDKTLELNAFNIQLFKKLPPLIVKKIDIFLNE